MKNATGRNTSLTYPKQKVFELSKVVDDIEVIITIYSLIHPHNQKEEFVILVKKGILQSYYYGQNDKGAVPHYAIFEEAKEETAILMTYLRRQIMAASQPQS